MAAPTTTERATLGTGAKVRRGRLLPYLVAFLVAATALGFGGREVYLRMTHVFEYDARVTADMVTMSSRVDGWVMEMPVTDGDRVQPGQVLIRVDDRIANLRVEALQAQIQGLRADRARLQAERRMAENQVDAKTRTRTSGVRVSEAARAALESDILLARQDLERSRSLYQRGVITDKQLETAQANAARLESTKRRMDAERLQAEGSLGEAEAEKDRLAVIDGQIASLQHAEANLEAMLRQQQVDLADRTIRSPEPAIIDRTFVEVGEYVSAGQRLLILHDPARLWVEANIKETQIRRLKVGQTVDIAVDAFPDDHFRGRVARIGSATTARFALLPTPNPSGNFTKVTQRLPVKIELVDPPRPLVPGMMVEVVIDVR